MSRRSRPHYHSGLEWILGVAFEDTLTRPARLAQGFTHVRCCGSPRASSPHGLAAPALASHDGRDCVQLPPARGCYHLAPRRTFTSNPVPMPGTPSSLRSARWRRGLTGHHNGVSCLKMEKRKPTYDLAAFKAAFDDADKLNVTGTALRSAAALGFGREEIVATIRAMRREHFYKSMTSHADHRIWQDVYHVPSE